MSVELVPLDFIFFNSIDTGESSESKECGSSSDCGHKCTWKLGSVWHGGAQPSLAGDILASQMLPISAVSHPQTSENFQVASNPVKKISKSHCVCCNSTNTMCCVIHLMVSQPPPPLCYCIPGVDAPLSTWDLPAFLISSSTYCLSPSFFFCFSAENVNQPEKIWWFVYVGGFENNGLACNIFQCNDELVVFFSQPSIWCMRSVKKWIKTCGDTDTMVAALTFLDIVWTNIFLFKKKKKILFGTGPALYVVPLNFWNAKCSQPEMAKQHMISSQRLLQSSVISETVIWQKYHFRGKKKINTTILKQNSHCSLDIHELCIIKLVLLFWHVPHYLQLSSSPRGSASFVRS